jgi:hypothetical protein
MKKLLSIITLSLFAVACNNESEKTNDSAATNDSVNTAPVNEAISNPNRVPGSNQPGEAMGNGDTSSYENMSQRLDSTK